MVHIIIAKSNGKIHDPLVYSENNLESAKLTLKNLQKIADLDANIEVRLFTNCEVY